MKANTRKQLWRRGSVWVFAIALGVSGFALEAAAGSQGTVESSETRSEPAAQKNETPKEKGVIAQIKEWVQEKWRQWNGDQPAVVVSRPKVQKRPPGVPLPTAPRVSVPSEMIGQNLAAPPSAIGSTGTENIQVGLKDLPRSPSGVPVYTIASVDRIPLLDIGREEAVSSDRYRLEGDAAKFFDEQVAHQIDSPPLLTPKQMKEYQRIPKPAGAVALVKFVAFQPKGRVSREAVDKIDLRLTAENPFALRKFVALTAEELRFLSGLLLYQQGDKCPVALGLFHALSKSSKYVAEGNYYLAMCSKKLGLTTDFIDRARRVIETGDAHYVSRILPEVSPDVPYEFIEPFGKALHKISSNQKLMKFEDSVIAGNVFYILANYGAQSGNFKLAQSFGRRVPEGHAKWPQAQFLLALGEYQVGSKSRALEIQKELVAKLDSDKTKAEFQALVALNLARMNFQEANFQQARDWFLKVYKDHPLWLQSLQEMGWAQLQNGDFEGAIGNMYSVQSPYFSAVYKPESYVVRTIGYLNLCQYGDAYRSLTTLEKTYRPWLSAMTTYQKSKPNYSATVRKFISLKSASAEIDGLPSQVIREIARHKDYLNLQVSLNRQVDERNEYTRLDREVNRALGRARWLVNSSRQRANQLRAKIASIKANPQLEVNRLAWKAELDNELNVLSGLFFEIDLFNEAKASLQGYKAEVVAGADQRIEFMKSRITVVLEDRLRRMRDDLARVLDNNELLRYEVFAGSGENIRFQVAGGEKGNRIPASVMPKSLKWDFDGEYWEDEIGHYRSSLKNNCPDSKTASL